MRYLMKKHRGLPAYIPGDHEEGEGFIRLNTNESPYPPSPGVAKAVAAEMDRLQFYNDPDCTALRGALAELYGITPDRVTCGNGSDEVLYFAFNAFADSDHPIILPDITYGYYDLFAASLGIPLRRVPLREDFSLSLSDYEGSGCMAVIANPNAPTGLAIPAKKIADFARSNLDRVVLVDEAYGDFGAESCIPYTAAVPNLLVVRTYSKSRSLAGGRIGFAIGCPELIAEIETLRNAINLYSVSRMAQAAGIAACKENDYYLANCRRIMDSRAYTEKALRELGFTVLPSLTNFVFAHHPEVSSAVLQPELRRRGILIRRWDSERIGEWSRITIGTQTQMEQLIAAIREVLAAQKRT